MKYFYIEKASLINGTLTVIFQTENRIDNYKEITNFGELIEYHGENIPSDWEFNGEYIYSAKEKPSEFHRFNGSEWVVFNQDGFNSHCVELIDKVKAEVLEYGFDYQGHRQRCRDKDIALMTSTITALNIAKQIKNKDLKIKWYFEDNAKQEMGLVEISTLMMYGVTFVQSVYDTENYFKTLEKLKIVSKDEFESKRKEMHQILVGG